MMGCTLLDCRWFERYKQQVKSSNGIGEFEMKRRP